MRFFLSILALTCTIPAFAIRGGSYVNIQNAPWQISIQSVLSGHICGGSLVSPSVIITAAHCVTKLVDEETETMHPMELRIMGEHSALGKMIKLPKIKRIIPHHDFDLAKSDNHDIALIQLDKEINASSSNSPVSLINSEATAVDDIFQNFSDAKFSISGWGTDRFFGSTSDKLKKTDVKVVASFQDKSFWTEERINNLYIKNHANIGSNALYVQSLNQRDAACYGDSGGPLIMYQDNKPVIIGVLTKSDSLNCDNGFSLYTDIRPYLEWIRDLNLEIF